MDGDRRWKPAGASEEPGEGEERVEEAEGGDAVRKAARGALGRHADGDGAKG